MSEARNRLLSVMPFIRMALEGAKIEMPDGEVSLSITVKNADRGRIVASFEKAFLEDVAEVLGIKDLPAWILESEGD